MRPFPSAAFYLARPFVAAVILATCAPLLAPSAPLDTADAGLRAQFAALHADLLAGVPSIVCMHYDDKPGTTEHFRLILGYDAATDEVIYHEPAVDDGSYLRMKRDLLLQLWPLKYD